MSLNRREHEQTSLELRRHLDVSGLSRDELAAWLGLSRDEIDHILAMDGNVDPTDVWLVRDALDQLVREQGRDAGGWSKLDDAGRIKAQQWFALREVPARS